MKRDTIEDLIIEPDDNNGVEEIDLSESAMKRRAFKKFYFQQKKGINITEDEDCQDIEEDDGEIDEEELDIEDEDTEIEGEDLP